MTELDYTRPETLDSDTLAGWEALGADGRAAIEAQARQDALTFADEFPGELIEGDWDSEAWGIARDMIARAIDPTDDRLAAAEDAAGHDVAWGLYAQTLRAEVERLAAG